ncbi:MAG TPA: primosomal protein N' [Bryobacteraceae bacterium]|nr:primosomal protein N' [Bryobacteraceae bacterium]
MDNSGQASTIQNGHPLYIDVSLPVPLDQAFTYALPETLRHRVAVGCRVLVPFGARRLTGVVLRCHHDPPGVEAREALRLFDAQPVLGEDLLSLGRWIAAYYCAPLGEVLRGMLPLAAEIRRGKIYSLTDAGRDATRQMLLGSGTEDAVTQVLRALESRPLSSAWLARKFPLADKAIKSLEKRGFIFAEQIEEDRDPLRAASGTLRVELAAARPDLKLTRPERELVAFLELHPGSHNLKDLEGAVKGASAAARSLGRKGVLKLEREPMPVGGIYAGRAAHSLNAPQQEAFARIHETIQSRQFRTWLLHGVTGSGKTEVYLKAIDSALAAGRGALLLVPEIALTPAMAGQFFARFGDKVAILHSAFTDNERAGQWRKIRSGAAGVVVGTRSGVFAPVRNLGLIVVDEEHDQSYKQEETPRYNGRDVAIVRGKEAGACVVLGSATPSLESRYNAERGKYGLLELPDRVEARPMPQVELIDMRVEFLETRKQATFSRRLLEAIAFRLENGEQTMLLLNRRGFSSAVACRACGERVGCVNCSLSLTYHRRDRRMLCHYCNYAERVPDHCPKCQSEHIYFLGLGSEKVEEELHRELPKARIARLDRDTVSGKRHYESILHNFREGHYDILVGTQMIAKGHDIPNVTLVGVISADIGLGMPDFRAAERTFQILTQMSGRAGRGNLPGVVLIQTISPDHYAVRLAGRQDYQGFYQQELEFRRALRYPPFSAMANILVRSEKQEVALRLSGDLGQLLTPPPDQLKILGPAEAPVPRLKNEYRYQFLIKAANRAALSELLHRVRHYAVEKKWGATALVIDVDPVTLM